MFIVSSCHMTTLVTWLSATHEKKKCGRKRLGVEWWVLMGFLLLSWSCGFWPSLASPCETNEEESNKWGDKWCKWLTAIYPHLFWFVIHRHLLNVVYWLVNMSCVKISARFIMLLLARVISMSHQIYVCMIDIRPGIDHTWDSTLFVTFQKPTFH